MRHFYYLPLAAALASCSAADLKIEPSELVRVSCSSQDGGKTCSGYGEIYGDGTSDACGRIPGGPEFAFKLTYELKSNILCETVTKTSHPKIMQVGETFCSIYLERMPHEFTYRFTDDPPGKLRHSYDATRSDKWCQNLIDELQ